MHTEVKQALTVALTEALTTINQRKIAPRCVYLRLERKGHGGWSRWYEWGSWYDDWPKPNSADAPQIDWSKISAAFGEALEVHHPEHLGILSIRSDRKATHWVLMAEHLVRGMTEDLWRRYSPNIGAAEVEREVDEFSNFVDSTSIGYLVYAPLENLRLDVDVDEIRLADDLKIVRLSEEEVNLLFGGPLVVNSSPPAGDSRSFELVEYAIKTYFADEKIVYPFSYFIDNRVLPPLSDEKTAADDLSRRLDWVVKALRTFNAGPVGYREVCLVRATYAPVELVRYLGGREYLPRGLCQLSKEDVQEFQEHARYMMRGLHPTFELACSRLADATIRVSDIDRLIDAVIGLEAVLLYEQEAELSYRFALNYASLFDTHQERKQAFRDAQIVYGVRSKVAHGKPIRDGVVKVTGGKMPVSEVAQKACKMLRRVIEHFLPTANAPAYTRAGYWLDRTLGGTAERSDSRTDAR